MTDQPTIIPANPGFNVVTWRGHYHLEPIVAWRYEGRATAGASEGVLYAITVTAGEFNVSRDDVAFQEPSGQVRMGTRYYSSLVEFQREFGPPGPAA